MPGQGSVKAIEKPLLGHEGLARAALLAGAAVENDGAAAGALPGEVFLYGTGGGQSPRPQEVMPAAVAAAPGHQFPVLGFSGLL